MLEEFESWGLTLEKHQMFSLQKAPEEFENEPITGHYAFEFEKNSVREIT